MAKKPGWTDEEIRLAAAAGVVAELTEPHAKAATYNKGQRQIEVRLSNGASLSIPVGLMQGLAEATHAELSDILLLPHGTAIHFPQLNVDFTVPGLVSGIFGNASWMKDLRHQGHREVSARGGSAKSKAKSASARENGKKGGRPKKTLV